MDENVDEPVQQHELFCKYLTTGVASAVLCHVMSYVQTKKHLLNDVQRFAVMKVQPHAKHSTFCFLHFKLLQK